MTKPVIVTRASNGAALTWAQGDANLENLRDATISIKAGTGGTDVVSDLNGTLTLVEGTNVTITGDNTAKTITIDAAGGGIALTDLSGSRGIDYNNTTGEIKLTSSGLPTVYAGNVSSIDGDNGDWIYVPSVSAGFMMSYQIQFQGAGLMGTNIMMGMNYWIKDVDYANNRFTISDTMGGSVKDLNNATGLTDVTYQISMGGGGSSTYKLQYNSSMGTVSWTTDSTMPATQSLSGLSDVSIMPPVTDGYVLTYDSMMGKWQAEAPAGGGISNVVDDTTPQLGGTLDANGNDIDMGTNTITDTKVGNWDTAYSWGNHASAGYQSSLGFTPENSANKGTANGYASLDSNGLVPSTQLPSYVDDVLEYASLVSFPVTGETGKIYVAADTSRSYRWTGSVYSEIIASPGTTDNVTEGSTNLYFTTSRARSSVSAGTGISYDSATGVITSTVTPGQSVTISNDTTSTNGYVPWVDSNTGTLSTLKTTSGTLYFNAGAGVLSANQFNANGNGFQGVIGGTVPLAGNFTTLTVKAGNELRLADSDSSHYVGFKAPATVTTNKIWTLPAVDGTNGQVLRTNGSGTLSWATAGGGGSPVAVLEANTHNTTITAASSGTLNAGWTEVLDASSIVTTNGTTQFTLGAGTYLIGLSSTGMVASKTSPGTGVVSTGSIYFDIYSVTGAATLHRYWQSGSSIFVGTSNPSVIETSMGPVYLEGVVTPSVSTTYEIRYNNTGWEKQFNAYSSPGKSFRVVITKLA